MVGSILMGRNPRRQMKQLENTMIASRNLVQGAKTLNAVRKAYQPVYGKHCQGQARIYSKNCCLDVKNMASEWVRALILIVRELLACLSRCVFTNRFHTQCARCCMTECVCGYKSNVPPDSPAYNYGSTTWGGRCRNYFRSWSGRSISRDHERNLPPGLDQDQSSHSTRQDQRGTTSTHQDASTRQEGQHHLQDSPSRHEESQDVGSEDQTESTARTQTQAHASPRVIPRSTRRRRGSTAW